MYSQIFRIISQNPDYVKTHCKDLNNRFHFACQKWTSQQNDARNAF